MSGSHGPSTSRFREVPPGTIAAIVTHLDMTAPPAALPPKPRPSLRLEWRARPDLDWYRNLYRRVGEEWLWFSRLLMTDADLAAMLHDPDNEVYVLLDGEAEIGMLELDWRQRPDCEIVFFGLVPEAFGGGAGAWLIGQAQDIAFGNGAARLWLHTCTFDHPKAMAFYMAHGFRPYKREIELAPDPRLYGGVRPDAAAFHPVIAPPDDGPGDGPEDAGPETP